MFRRGSAAGPAGGWARSAAGPRLGPARNRSRRMRVLCPIRSAGVRAEDVSPRVARDGRPREEPDAPLLSQKCSVRPSRASRCHLSPGKEWRRHAHDRRYGLAVTGGVDTHAEVHVAGVADQTGRVLGTREFPATAEGYAAALAWMRGHGESGQSRRRRYRELRGRAGPLPGRAGHRGGRGDAGRTGRPGGGAASLTPPTRSPPRSQR